MMMTIRVAGMDQALAKLDRIIDMLTEEKFQMAQIDDALTALKSQVTNLQSAEASAVALLNGIPQMIHDAVAQAQAAGATPQQVQAITDAANSIQQNASDLAAAVTANTPATPAPPAPPPATP